MATGGSLTTPCFKRMSFIWLTDVKFSMYSLKIAINWNKAVWLFLSSVATKKHLKNTLILKVDVDGCHPVDWLIGKHYSQSMHTQRKVCYSCGYKRGRGGKQYKKTQQLLCNRWKIHLQRLFRTISHCGVTLELLGTFSFPFLLPLFTMIYT